MAEKMTDKEKRFQTAHIRQELVKALKVDLIGPMEADEVIDEDPRFEYLTGMLYAQSLAERAEFCDQEVDMDADITSGSDFSSGTDEEEGDVVLKKKFEQQSSVGLSFYVRKDCPTVFADVSWGDYTEESEKYTDPETGKEKNRKVYRRQSKQSTIAVDFASFDRFTTIALPEDSNVYVRVSKIGLKNEYMLVTAYLMNRRPLSDDELPQIMFQAKLEVCSEGNVFYAENICREIVSAEEHYYSERPIFGRGRGCAATWDTNALICTNRISTAFIPEYEIPGVSPNIEGFDENHFWMMFMSKPANKEGSIARLTQLADAYDTWIQNNLVHSSMMDDPEFKAKIGDNVIKKCNEALRRIREGIHIINTSDTAFEAFCFMNRVMTYQRSIMFFSREYGKGVECSIKDFIDTEKKAKHFCWRPFQIAFVLMNIKSIVDPYCDEREIVDLLYFPTGGGKTEAYLGLMAFTIANRRLTSKPDDELNKDGGVTVILRYTLRLLTAQQRDRLTKMIIAAELIRRKEPQKYGKEPFSIGFWVGGGVTPNKFDDLIDKPSGDHGEVARNKSMLFKQLPTCPCCGRPLSERNYYILPEQKSVEIYCSSGKSCIFYRYNADRFPIPVYFVDEEIYSKCPTIILATVDKFAHLPWGAESNSLFGRVDRKCSRDGYIAIGSEHPARHPATEEYPAATVTAIKPFAPPELIVQDELHLITGPLGTIYGAYETMIQDLCSYKMGDKKILPKYVVSTATIKNAEEQTRCLYARKNTMQFPASGFVASDSFFIKEIPLEENPFRKYVGISAIGQSVKTTLLRVYAILLQTAGAYTDIPEYKDFLDPYYTLVGYFNSIRELGGAVRLLQDDIPARIYRLVKKYGYKKVRKVFPRQEITSRISSTKIGEILDQLNTPYMDEKNCYSTVIATNMIAVGMDVDRLGLMTVVGQPKQNSEYIQATSRIGRQHPGLVFTIYNPYRPRDLSHYENFTGYHAQLYRHVEGTTATPFSARARDRVLHALVIAAVRLKYPEFASNSTAKNIQDLGADEREEIISIIQDRLSIVNPAAKAETREEIEEFFEKWDRLAEGKQDLRYYVVDTKKYNRLMNYYGEPTASDEKPTLNSMREVEQSSNIYYYWEE